ncbi:MAG: transcription termination/antitermination protein NusG [Stellaceae bacterium]
MIGWYAVHTQPHAETRARDNLLRQGYAAYLPRCRVYVSHARRRRVALRPLFPRYLFAGVDRAAMRLRPILSTFGVADIVRTGEEPAPVPDEILAALREREAAGLFDQLDPARRLRLGEMVRITAGAFEDMIGRLVELRDQDRVVVLLDLMGRAVRAQLGAAAVEAA